MCDAAFSRFWNETLLDDRCGGGAATCFATAVVVATATAVSPSWMNPSVCVNRIGSELDSASLSGSCADEVAGSEVNAFVRNLLR